MGDATNDKDVQIKEEKEETITETTDNVYSKLFPQTLDPSLKNTSDDVQRAIKNLKEMSDEELKEFLDEDFMQGLDIVDAWERDEDKNRENEQNMTGSAKQGKNQPSR